VRLCRSLLFVPADQEAKLRKAATLAADGIILDLEDGVAPPHKAGARAGAMAALAVGPFGHRECLVRINALDSPWGRDDLAALRAAASKPGAVVIPKIDRAEQVEEVARALDSAMDLLPHIETAQSLLAAAAIARCHPRVSGLFFGAGDYLVETGGVRTPQVLLHPRSVVAAAAAAARVIAIDTPYFRLGDLEGLETDTQAAADLGFAGKAAIHPEQVPIINRVFTPPPERVAWAERVLATAAQSGTGVFVVDGEMADAMTLRMARRVLAAARTGQSPEPS
jgi:citrate lyase subunit beta/citryl-CoA lyase